MHTLGFVAHLDFYSAEDLDTLLHRSARILGVPITADLLHKEWPLCTGYVLIGLLFGIVIGPLTAIITSIVMAKRIDDTSSTASAKPHFGRPSGETSPGFSTPRTSARSAASRPIAASCSRPPTSAP